MGTLLAAVATLQAADATGQDNEELRARLVESLRMVAGSADALQTTVRVSRLTASPSRNVSMRMRHLS
jgi:hypothetical protein